MGLFDTLGRNIATAGQALGLPDYRISERLSGSSQQNQPYYTFNRPVPQPAASSSIPSGKQTLPSSTAFIGPSYPGAVQGPAYPGSQGGGGNNTLSGGQPTNNNNQDYGSDMAEQAKSQAQIELEQYLNEFDYQAEQGRNQIGQLETQQSGQLSELETMRGRTGKEATTAKTDAETATMQEKDKALSTAQDVQKGNRNILRALGILSSSAAGEMLTKPMNEFATQAAQLGSQLVKRKSEVDQWLMDRNQDFDAKVQETKDKFTGMIQNIQTDLRFNDRQRLTAVKAANQALKSTLTEIAQRAQDYKNAAAEYNNGVLDQIAQLMLYQNPNADISSIINAKLSAVQGPQQTQTAAMTLSEQQKKKQQNGLLG